MLATADLRFRHGSLSREWYGDSFDASDAVAAFDNEVGRMPRCASELEAWSDGEAEFAGYLAGNPF